MKELNKTVELLAGKVEDVMVLGENGVFTTPEGFYETTLPEGVTKEAYIALQEHNGNLAAAGTLALGRKSIPVMQSNVEIGQTSLSVPTFNRDRFDFSFTKERPVPVKNADGVQGTKTSWGSSSVSFEQYNLGKRGAMAQVKAMLSEQTADAFAAPAANEKAA
jgi:hypothetical protein